jgi:hypothetical protein
MTPKWSQAQEFKDYLKQHFRECSQTGWGKLEIAAKLEGLWAAFLLQYLDKGAKGDAR